MLNCFLSESEIELGAYVLVRTGSYVGKDHRQI